MTELLCHKTFWPEDRQGGGPADRHQVFLLNVLLSLGPVSSLFERALAGSVCI